MKEVPLPTFPTELPAGVKWVDRYGHLTPEAKALILAYNDLGLVPKIASGKVESVSFKSRTPIYEGELK